MEPNAKRPKVEGDEDVCCANDAVTLEWVEYDAATDALVVGETGHPLCTHAFFEEEQIRGYTRLEIIISIDRLSFHPMMRIEYGSKKEDADDVGQMLKEKFEYEFETSREAFCRKLMEFRETNRMRMETFGFLALPSIPFQDGTLMITHSKLAEADKNLKGLHYRLEPFLMFFIDGFQCIDTSDPNWTIFCAVFARENELRLIGYTMVYRCYTFPDHHRERIGQMFVLPGYQRQGVGIRMLEAVQAEAEKQNAIDLSIEDPTDPLERMKKTFDMERLLKCDWLKTLLQEKLGRLADESEETSLLLKKDEMLTIHETFRILTNEIESLWTALLFVESVHQPEKTACIANRLKRSWEISSQGDAHRKAIFQELSPDGQPVDSFLMMKCNTGGISKIIENVMVISTEPCYEASAQRDQLFTQKINTSLQLVSHFVSRQN